MQRVAVQLRQKQEYNRAEKLLHKAISVKKQLIGSEVSEDIAYLYNELAVTYHANEDLENASKCIRKQLAIWDSLGKNNSMDYAQVLCFLGEIHKDLGEGREAIEALKRGVEIHERAQAAESEDMRPTSMVSIVGGE